MITKVAQFSSTPTAVSDYEAQNAHLMAFINQVNSQAFILTNPTGTTEPTIKQDTYINHGGTLYTVDTADETISGTPADGNVYIRLSVSGDNLVASYVTDISAFTWSQVYGYLSNGTDIILPYMLVKSGTSWTKYRMDIKTPQYVTDQNLRTTDSPTFSDATISGHTIDSELDTLNSRVNQGVKTTDSPTFATVNTGYGDNDVFKISTESYSVESDSVNISSMAISEIRFIYASLTAPTTDAYIKTPTVGNFVVVANAAAQYQDIGSPTPANSIIAGIGSGSFELNCVVVRIS
jgi:hypothetical protein